MKQQYFVNPCCSLIFRPSPQNLPFDFIVVNLLTPNVNYSGFTAPLTSKVAFYIFIKKIKVLNILNMVYILYSLRIFLFKMQFLS